LAQGLYNEWIECSGSWIELDDLQLTRRSTVRVRRRCTASGWHSLAGASAADPSPDCPGMPHMTCAGRRLGQTRTDSRPQGPGLCVSRVTRTQLQKRQSVPSRPGPPRPSALASSFAQSSPRPPTLRLTLHLLSLPRLFSSVPSPPLFCPLVPKSPCGTCHSVPGPAAYRGQREERPIYSPRRARSATPHRAAPRLVLLVVVPHLHRPGDASNNFPNTNFPQFFQPLPISRTLPTSKHLSYTL
jgi:hypothetical protein